MRKALSELSLEELWELFPIVLKEHNPQYKDWYQSEANHLLEVIGHDNIVRISHIGSTSVKGLIAKPTVDILMELGESNDIKKVVKLLQMNGWTLMSSEYEPVVWLIFNKGYTPDGFADRVYHLHVRYRGDWDELYFRDYLSEHPEIADKYAKLKLQLWKKYEHNRDGYTEGKSEFIKKYTAKARIKYEGRYLPKQS